jgi:hypothetical protein
MVENSPSSQSDASDPDPNSANALPTPLSTASSLWSFAVSPLLGAILPQPDPSESSSDDSTMSAEIPTPSLSVEQLLQVLAGLRSQQVLPVLTEPRHGGISATGVWTGMGAGGTGLRPYSKYCMREFKTDAIKNHQHMHPIEDRCKQGLRDSPELHFSLSHEPNAHTVVSSIRAFEKLMINCGMDGAFTIIDKNHETISFLQQPGMVNQRDLLSWCADISVNGVWTKDDNGDPVRAPLCPYDQVNMDWSAEAVLNSCTPALRYDLEQKVPLTDQSGPQLMMALLTMLYRPSLSKIRELRSSLEALDIRKYPGENVTMFCHDASKLVCEIKMNFMKDATVTDLPTVALTGLHHCTDVTLQAKVTQHCIDHDVNGFESAVGNKKTDALELLQQLDAVYRVLINLKIYAPARENKKASEKLAGYMAGMADAAEERLKQDRGGAGSGKPGAACWDCGSKDHLRGHADCKGKPDDSKGDSKARPSRHGLDDATVAKLVDLTQAKLATMPAREHIPDSAEYSITISGQVVAKYCRHCGRFVKGTSQHFTKDHTGTRNTFGYQGPSPQAPAPAPAPALPPLAAPVAAMGALDLSNVPRQDSTDFFMQRQHVSYDFAAPKPVANVASISLEERVNSLLDSGDHDDLLVVLGNEFGGY